MLGSKSKSKCPICDATAKARGENPSFPFCSARCKMVDLGKWMNEEYRVPVEEEDADLDDESDASSQGGAGKIEARAGGGPQAARARKWKKDVRH